MKRLLLLICLGIGVSLLKAQDTPLYIFDQFHKAKIHFKNRSVTVALMNYDAVNDKMFFKQGDDLMELTNLASIDSIVWSGVRTFLPYEEGFLEQVQQPNGPVFIRWRIKNVNVGSRGALGAVTQGKVESISIRSMGVFSASDASGHSADVYQQKNANEYFIHAKGEFMKFRNLKQVLKAFPEHKEEIQTFVKEKGIKMNEPLLVLELLNYCLSLD